CPIAFLHHSQLYQTSSSTIIPPFLGAKSKDRPGHLYAQEPPQKRQRQALGLAETTSRASRPQGTKCTGKTASPAQGKWRKLPWNYVWERTSFAVLLNLLVSIEVSIGIIHFIGIQAFRIPLEY